MPILISITVECNMYLKVFIIFRYHMQYLIIGQEIMKNVAILVKDSIL